MSIRKAIVPVDGSDVALKAVRLAADFAKKEGWEILLLHAVEMPHLTDVVEDISLREQAHEGMLEHGESILSNAKEYFKAPGIKISTKMIEGPAAQTIIEEASAECCGVIIIGSIGMGRGKLESLLLGSVAEHVIRNTSIPIILVKENTVLD